MSEWESSLSEDDHRAGAGRRQRDGNARMIRILIGVIVLLIIAGGGLGFLFFSGAISTAQPTTSATTAATVPTPTPRPTTAGQPPATGAATDQGAAAAAPQPIVTKQSTYGDWIYMCLKAKASDPTPTCSITQSLADAKTKAPLFLWRIIATDKGLVAEWQTRTGIMVDRGISLDTGGDKPIVIPFQFCTPTGCQAQANLAPDFIDSLGKATKAAATVFPVGAQGITLTLSVKGLPDALAALKSPS